MCVSRLSPRLTAEPASRLQRAAQGATCSVRSGVHLLQLHLQLEAWSNADSTLSLKSGYMYEEWVQIPPLPRWVKYHSV